MLLLRLIWRNKHFISILDRLALVNLTRSGGFHKSVFNRPVERLVHVALKGEFNFRFARMNINVHLRRVQLDVKHCNGETPNHQLVFICFGKRVVKRFVHNASAVDKKYFHKPVRTRQIVQPRKSANGDSVLNIINLRHCGGGFAPQNAMNGVFQNVIARCEQNLLAVTNKPNRNVRVTERLLVADVRNGGSLRSVLFQKLHSRRGIVKNIPDNNRCSLRAAGRLVFNLLAALHDNMRALAFTGRLCEKLRSADRCNAAQRFAAEAERSDAFKVARGFNFACRMAQKSRFCVITVHSAAVIRYAHIGYTAALDFNRDGFCPGVDSIFHKLLYNACRALDNLPCGDFFGSKFIKNVYSSHAIPSF